MLFNLTRLAGLLLALFSLPVHALTIFACQPDWASLAKEHAPRAEVFSATTAFQDPHFIQARPSLISKMRQADLVICSGAELEVGWLPELQRQSRNAKVSPGGEGLLFTTDYVAVLDKHDHVDRSLGDVHAGGNPHVQFAVADMINISQALTDRLKQLDPKRVPHYVQAGEHFRQRWAAQMLIWKNKSLSLKGKKVVGYHATYRYLFAWLGMTQVADLEPKPGVSPTTAHLAQLAKLDSNGLYAIVYASHQNSQAAEWLANRTQLSMIVLPQSVGGNEQAHDLMALIDNSINLLLANN